VRNWRSNLLVGCATLSIALTMGADDAAPTEFLLFRKGLNETSKGSFLFDDAAAAAVMSEYEKHGADIMIDLEHLSLDGEARHFDPDARGWCKLALRDGALWAVDVRWTPDGAARVEAKRQRYTSPAFLTEGKTRRIRRLLNVAIVAMPATHQLAPLVAASDSSGGNVNAFAKALGLSDDATEEDVLKALAAVQAKAKLADGPPPPVPGEEKKDEAAPPPAALSALEEKFEKLAAAQARSEVAAILLDARKSKSVSPAFERLAMARSADEVRELVAVLPPAPRGEFHAPAGPAPTDEAIELSDAEELVCRLTDVSRDDVLAHKKTLAARAAGKVI
jgi:phage I-like protein